MAVGRSRDAAKAVQRRSRRGVHRAPLRASLGGGAPTSGVGRLLGRSYSPRKKETALSAAGAWPPQGAPPLLSLWRGRGAYRWSARPSPPSRIGKLISARSARCSTSTSRPRTRRPAARSTRRTTSPAAAPGPRPAGRAAARCATPRRPRVQQGARQARLRQHAKKYSQSLSSARVRARTSRSSLEQTITGINTGSNNRQQTQTTQPHAWFWSLVWPGLVSLLGRCTSRRTALRTTPRTARRSTTATREVLRPLADELAYGQLAHQEVHRADVSALGLMSTGQASSPRSSHLARQARQAQEVLHFLTEHYALLAL